MLTQKTKQKTNEITKQNVLRMLLIAPLLALTACVETSAPLCDASNKVDVDGFARDYSLAVMVDPEKPLQEGHVSITRTGRGEYVTTSAGSAAQPSSTCKVGNWTIAESPTEYGTYRQAILSLNGGVTSFNQMIVDAASLMAGGVQVDFIEREVPHKQSLLMRALGQNEPQKQKVMIIKADSAQARDVIAHLAKPLVLGTSLF